LLDFSDGEFRIHFQKEDGSTFKKNFHLVALQYRFLATKITRQGMTNKGHGRLAYSRSFQLRRFSS
jgi:hypothetical protein